MRKGSPEFFYEKSILKMLGIEKLNNQRRVKKTLPAKNG